MSTSEKLLPEIDEVNAEIFALTRQLSHEHNDEAGHLQHFADWCTGVFANPTFSLFLTGGILVWMLINFCIYWFHLSSIDPAPFVWLTGAITTLSLYCVVLVLSTQRRGEKLMSRLERLSVEMAVISDEKISKAIELLENARRLSEGAESERDSEADRLSQPVDHAVISRAIKDVWIREPLCQHGESHYSQVRLQRLLS